MENKPLGALVIDKLKGISPSTYQCKLKENYALVSAAFLAANAFTVAADFAGLALPKLPANIFPFFVLMSPRPIFIVCLSE
jgi:hypothetical protein